MRLLHFADGGGLRITEFIGASIPPYAILSHTWGADDEEVSYRDVVDAPVSTYKTKAGYKKLVFCLVQAALDGLRYSWVDTCSIDRSSSAELSEAINSMFRWYQNAERCYVYLADITESKPDASITSSRWFTRGWTLQELLAPKSLQFYTAEGLPLGNKISRKNDIQLATNIPSEALDGNKPLAEFDFEQRFSWAEKRQTKREEDAAYCLLGLFDVHIPLIYGEGRQKAMKRLRREIAESMKELNGFSRLNTKDGSPSPSPMMNIRRKVTVESTQENEPSQGMDSAPLPPPRTNRSVMQASVMLVADPKLLKDTPVSQLPAELVGQKFVEEYYPNFRHNPGEQQVRCPASITVYFNTNSMTGVLWRGISLRVPGCNRHDFVSQRHRSIAQRSRHIANKLIHV